MTRILLRTPKDAFEIVSPEATLAQNVIGGNSGNLIFTEAAQRILSTRDARITADRLEAFKFGADHINERFDVYVMPLANAFRPTFEATLTKLTALIERLRIPVVVLGVGAQATVDYDAARLRPMEPAIRAFMRAVLDRGPSVGVRGEFTRDYLRGLGFDDIEVIGCPSMFLHGDRLIVTKRVPALGPESPISINVSPYVKPMGPIVMSHLARYPNLRYVAQDLPTLEMLLWGDPQRDEATPTGNPVHTSHPLFQERRVRFYVDPWPWIDDLREVSFSFGTRIHGNIAALLAGTPAVVLAHDSRTLELARYFEIPHRRIREVPADVDAADLFAEADIGPLVRGQATRFATFAGFLERHGLRHVFLEGEDGDAFDRRVATTGYPAAVGYTDVRPVSGPARRIRRLRGVVRRELRRRGLPGG